MTRKNNKKSTTLQKMVADSSKDLQVITLNDGKEAIIGEMSYRDLFNFAHINRLRINLVAKDESQSDEWTVLPIYTCEELCLEQIILLYFQDAYQCIDFEGTYSRESAKYVGRLIRSGASPIEIEKAIQEKESITRMFKEFKLGYRSGYSLVMAKDYTEQMILLNYSTCLSFKHITLAYALTEVTEETTAYAAKVLLSGKNIPCVMGMMPEDVAKILDTETKLLYGIEPRGEYFMGPFIIIDGSGDVGFSYRESKDGKTWFWTGGEHSGSPLMDSMFFDETESIDLLLEKSTDEHYMMWKPVKLEYDETRWFINLPTVD